MPFRRSSLPGFLAFLIFTLLAATAEAHLTDAQRAANLASFEQVWSTVRDHHPDPNLNGLDWNGIHESTRPLIARADSMDEVRELLRAMLAKLNSSHYAIIASELYRPVEEPSGETKSPDATAGIVPTLISGSAVVGSVAPDSPAARAGVRPGMVLDSIDGAKVAPILRLGNSLRDQEGQRLAQRSIARKLNGAGKEPLELDVLDENGQPRHLEIERTEPAGKLITFGNLPQSRLVFESRLLPGGAGYIHFNEFLDPVSIMPQFQAAVERFSKAPGIVLDLRDNPGGIGIMAMGIAGFFVDQAGQKLGEMKMREATLKFVIFPRADTYAGKLAIVVNAGSASTTEILAQGLQDLGRARIFGTRTAGAALPSDIVRLPNGDGFQFAQASYTSRNGKVLEGAGVTPDVDVALSREALLAGRDPALEAAASWAARPSLNR